MRNQNNFVKRSIKISKYQIVKLFLSQLFSSFETVGDDDTKTKNLNFIFLNNIRNYYKGNLNFAERRPGTSVCIASLVPE